jgi:hypothetical protein
MAATSRALAEGDSNPIEVAAIDGVSFADMEARDRSGFKLNFTDAPIARFPRIAERARDRDRESSRAYELAVTRRDVGGLPVDVEFAQRAAFGVDSSGDVARHSRGSELRLGRGLGGLRREAQRSSFAAPTWYVFAAADDEALTWRPGSRSAFGGPSRGVNLEDRVEIGDMQLGVTYEHRGVQASLAYVEREVSTHIGSRSLSHDENFAGLTVTLTH